MRQLVIAGLRKSFGPHRVLADLDLMVPAGSLTAILGPSGSGKTTLLRIIAGFDRADGGTVTIGGQAVDSDRVHVAPERRRIGYVPQEGSLFPHLTVAANVGFGLPPRQRLGQRTSDLLAAVGLADLGKRYPHELSGGQQQRVALARALAIEPAVVLLDEPFASLDAHLRASVRADVQQIFRDAGTTALLVTHDQDEALAIADQVAVLRDGRIAQHATPPDLYSHPADPGIARFIGDANLLDGVRHGGMVDTVLGSLPAESGSAGTGPELVTVLIRPENVELRPSAGPTGPDAAAGWVVDCEYYGHDAVLRVQLKGNGDIAPIIVRTAGDHQLPPGSPVTLRPKGQVRTWPR
ncbi:MAG TPA: ABC transporter ATP-binding protein [Streptosporangiaceae bacterium]|nr:ABC transporter ATP-binding protein [Streptosporangiaceae bacterium]